MADLRSDERAARVHLADGPHEAGSGEQLILTVDEARWFLDELLPAHRAQLGDVPHFPWLTGSARWAVRRITVVLPRDAEASRTILKLSAFFTPNPDTVQVFVQLERGRLSLDPAVLAHSHRRRLHAAIARALDAADAAGLPLTPSHIREFTPRAARAAGLAEKRAVLRAGIFALEWDDARRRVPLGAEVRENDRELMS
ncbi:MULTISPECIES: hypothetical protein [Microbacterium]|uniref:hypothetical protein n=1 Tax=Microbacterium TaxID=33882 RepID=UPI00146CDB84|nr:MULTISPECIES: hypothetical protein [Microbacterium]